MPRIVVFAIDAALASSITAPMEMLRAGEQHYRARNRAEPKLEIEVVAETLTPLRMSGGLIITPTAAAATISAADLAIVPSLWRSPALAVTRHPHISSCLKRLAVARALLCSVGTGSYFLAQSGLLNGRPATTHWSYFDDFAARFPKVALQRQHLITQSGLFYCAGSVNSVADLMVHLIEGFFGSGAARQVESQFSPEIRRPFQTHGFIHGQASAHADEAVWLAQDWMRSHLGEPIRVPELAQHSGLSVRSFNRRFREAVGATPAVYLRDARLSAARDLLRQSNLSIGEIAQRVGYFDPSHFSRVFATRIGSTPQSYRRRVRGKLFAPADDGQR